MGPPVTQVAGSIGFSGTSSPCPFADRVLIQSLDGRAGRVLPRRDALGLAPTAAAPQSGMLRSAEGCRIVTASG